MVAVAEHLKHLDLPRQPTWLIGTLGLELRRLKSWQAVYRGGAFVEPHMPELREFKDFFLASVAAPDRGLAAVTEEYMVESTGCVSGRAEPRGVSCRAIPRSDMEARFQQDPQASTCYPRLRFVFPHFTESVLHFITQSSLPPEKSRH